MTPDAATIILTALTTGAAAFATESVKDAYSGFKSLIKKHFEKAHIDELETAPHKKSWQSVVQEELEEALPNADKATVQEAIEMAQRLLKAVEENAPEAIETVGFHLEDIKTAKDIEMEDIEIKGTGLNVLMKKLETDGGIKISGIRVDTTKN